VTVDYRPRIAITRWEKVPGEDIAEYHRRVLEAGGEPGAHAQLTFRGLGRIRNT
jgi:hypothetical protein